MAGNLSNATSFFDRHQAMNELESLKFAINSLTKLIPTGTFEAENAKNIVVGLRSRIDYLHDSFGRLTEEKVAADVARALEPKSLVRAAGQAQSSGPLGGIGFQNVQTDPALLEKLKHAAMAAVNINVQKTLAQRLTEPVAKLFREGA